MTTPLDRLLQHVTPSIGRRRFSLDLQGGAHRHLRALYARRNGFYAQEAALHVYPIGRVHQPMDLESWNRPGLWRHGYSWLSEDLVFFGENVFGEQFAVDEDGGVSLLELEQGKLESIAPSIDAWAERLLEDPFRWTGYRIAHEFQTKRGALKIGERVCPVVPIILGGDYSDENLIALYTLTAVRTMSRLARLVREVSDGQVVRIVLVDGEVHFRIV